MVTNDGFSEANIPASNWMKFTKVGDFVKGTLTGKNIKPKYGEFKEQTVYSLINAEALIDGKKSPEKEFNVGISSKYVNDRFKGVAPGTIIGIKFDKEIPAKVKGYSPAKSLMPNLFGVDKTFTPDVDFDN